MEQLLNLMTAFKITLESQTALIIAKYYFWLKLCELFVIMNISILVYIIIIKILNRNI